MQTLKHIVMATFATTVMSLSADILYWQIDNPQDVWNGGSVTFSYATVKAQGADDTSTTLEHYVDGVKIDGLTKAGVADGPGTSIEALYSGDFSSEDVKSFLVELYDSDGTITAWQTYMISDILDSVWKDPMSMSGTKPLSVTEVIPEPSSGLLLLFGIAGLALRRRRRLCALVVASVASVPLLAAQNDAMVSFSTVGPDTYADGTTVMDGERYALVWMPKGSAGVVFAADGSVTGGEIVLSAPMAKNGRCPKFMYEVSAEKIANLGPDGTWSVYLLDTRRWDAHGVASISPDLCVVNASAVTAASISVASGSSKSARGSVGVNTAIVSALPDGTPMPTITGITAKDGKAYITVKGTVPYLNYALATGDTPNAVSEKVDVTRTGAESKDKAVEFAIPVKTGSAFFKVQRR